MIKDGGIDRKDYEKSKQMYKSGDLKGLRKHIYKLDTEDTPEIHTLPNFIRSYVKNAKKFFVSNLDKEIDDIRVYSVSL